mmetsp:Transcript_36424/g.90825  ORF Transcript_36424/g.90825 Transcript_36424/m.90825 type:complete len:240 (-) Transcript_36424:1382-2101(-)
MDGNTPTLLGPHGPLQDLFGPEHPDVVVLLAAHHELALAGVPQRVVRGAGFELIQGVDELAPVTRVCRQALARPARHALVLVVMRVGEDVVDGELTADHELVQILVHAAAHRGPRRRRRQGTVRHVHHADLAVVHVGRQVRLDAQGHVVALPGVSAHQVGEEKVQLPVRLSLAPHVVIAAPLHRAVYPATAGSVQGVQARVDALPQRQLRERVHGTSAATAAAARLAGYRRGSGGGGAE